MYISKGNSKMTIPTWSLPSHRTCPSKTKLCSKHCYAVKAERQYKQVLPCRKQNYRDSLRGDFVDMLASIIGRGKSGYFRIHESGDFYSQEYLDKWIAIANRLPDIRFLAFTKCFGLDYSQVPSNLVIYWSIWPDTVDAPVKGRFAYAGDCGHDKSVDCAGYCDNCMVCFGGQVNVHFNIH